MTPVTNLLRRLKRKMFPPPVDIADEYIGRLFCAVPGMVEKGNLHAWNHAFERLPEDGAVVEIGCYAGQSMNAMLYYLERHGRDNPVFGCDAWVYDGMQDSAPPDPGYLQGVGERRDLDRVHYMRFVRESFVRNTRTFNPGRLPGVVHLSSDAFFEKWASGQGVEDVFGNRHTLGGPIAFCFVDGHHGYEASLRDWKNADRFLVSGGFLLLDDSTDQWETARGKVARDIAKDDRYEVVMKNPNYLFRKR